MKIPEGMLQKLESMVGSKKINPYLAKAPGRIEVLGNHTDYNSGLVLSATINKYVWALGVENENVRLHAMDFKEDDKFGLKDLNTSNSAQWAMYAMGIYWAFQRRRHNVRGITAVIHGDIPKGGGLSSSAALEVALANLVLSISEIRLNPKAAAMISFEAERLFCGISCGVMDQFTSQLGKPNSLLSINCRNLLTRDVTMDFDASFIVVDSKVVRAAGDALNKRRHECIVALTTLQETEWDIQNLSDISLEYLEKVKDALDEKLLNRVTHIVHENDRVKRGIAAIERLDLDEFGKIMNESHASSRDLYEVSHPNLDFLVSVSQKQKGVFGARLTGAGMGGAILALVKNSDIENFCQTISIEYESSVDLTPDIIPVTIPGGVIVQKI